MATFVMAGGGTGGHVIPALAVARELRARGHTVRFIGTERGLEARLVPAADFPIDWIRIGGLKRVGWRQAIGTLAALPASVRQAWQILDRVSAAGVFSTGGYAAGPVLLAACLKRIPIVMMEANAVPGFTHRHLARFAARAMVSFPETQRWFPRGRTEVTGLPVREEFFAVSRKPPGQPLTLLVTGGSQGSRTLNRAVEESRRMWPEGEVRLIHQTGAAAFPDLDERFPFEASFEVCAFIEDMPGAFARADLVLCRAGMSTLSELAAAGKPSILVPFPGASDQHQLRNAEAFERAGAARLILDREMNGTRLVEEVMRLAHAPERLLAMGEAARRLAKPAAARRAAEVLEEKSR
jgi:UDP-N-acetylglucosamine--N-acetylmuramyl-(pentapeptide) pyrophosphoryl-undecaprenol N-acetylglucosamine transferase